MFNRSTRGRFGVRFLVITVIALACQRASAQAWQLATDSPGWAGRWAFYGLVFDNKMWIIGGYNGGGNHDDVWYSADGFSWTRAGTGIGAVRVRMYGAAVFDGRMWIMGGDDHINVIDDVYSSTNGSSWTLATGSPGWGNRRIFPAVSYQGNMWIFGGLGAGGNTVWNTGNGSSWSQISGGAPWGSRSGHKAVVYDGRMWLSGGNGQNDVWYSTDGSSWAAATTSAGWAGRSDHGHEVLDGKMWIAGGNSFNDVWYSTNGANWTQQTAAAPWSGRGGHGMVALNNRLWIISGGGLTTDVWYFDPCQAVSVTADPTSQVGCPNAPAVFTVSTSGSTPVTYQWRRNGSNLSDGGHVSGATTATLTISPVDGGDAGNYDVVVTNGCGNDTSATATLTVPPGTDCNGNSVPDGCDIASTTSDDCNTNGVPDECDLSGATSGDCNLDNIPDECQPGGGNFVWTGSSGGQFTNSSNWDRGDVPGGLAQIVLSNAGASDNTCVLDGAGETPVCSLSMSATGSGRQILQINVGSTLRSNDGTTIGSGGEVALRGGELAGGAVVNGSNTISGYGTVSADVDNQGMIRASNGRILDFTGSSLSNAGSGVMAAPVSSLLNVSSTGVSQDGSIEIRTLAAAAFEQPVVNTAGATITLLGGSFVSPSLTNDPGASISGFGTIDGNVDNDGVMTVIADTQIVGNLQNDGTITIQNGILTVTGNVGGNGVIIGGFGG